MRLEERINILEQLGQRLKEPNEQLDAVMKVTELKNGWLTIANQKKAISAIANQFLNTQALKQWTSNYAIQDEVTSKRVGLIMAGNIPLVGFHDFLCVFISGHHSMIKLSSKDQYLLPYLIQLMTEIDHRVSDYTAVVGRLADFEAVIATGSNNTAKYFESYFGKVPHIIRKNRNGVAVFTGDESKEELIEFGKDVFGYFGLGCRNVSKIYLPKGFEFNPLLEALHENKKIVLHTKYKNNFDYNYAVYMLNKVKYQANGCILMIEKNEIPSNIATMHFEYYENVGQLETTLMDHQEEIQVIITGKTTLPKLETTVFGQAQAPRLEDYADGVDTMTFLVNL